VAKLRDKLIKISGINTTIGGMHPCSEVGPLLPNWEKYSVNGYERSI